MASPSRPSASDVALALAVELDARTEALIEAAIDAAERLLFVELGAPLADQAVTHYGVLDPGDEFVRAAVWPVSAATVSAPLAGPTEVIFSGDITGPTVPVAAAYVPRAWVLEGWFYWPADEAAVVSEIWRAVATNIARRAVEDGLGLEDLRAGDVSAKYSPAIEGYVAEMIRRLRR